MGKEIQDEGGQRSGTRRACVASQLCVGDFRLLGIGLALLKHFTVLGDPTHHCGHILATAHPEESPEAETSQ